MLELAQVGSDDVVMDLGCGDGRILIMAVQDFGAKRAVGYELETHIVTLAAHNIRSQNLQDRITVIRDDLFNANIAEADVITVYLTTMALEPSGDAMEDHCGTCVRCIEACPTEAISGERKELHVVDQDKCIKCGKCFTVCRCDAVVKVQGWLPWSS